MPEPDIRRSPYNLPMSFPVGEITVGGAQLFLIAGPCVIESEEHALRMAAAIADVCRELGVPYIFKASYDKANRTSLASYRGPGLAEGLRILGRIRDELKIPVLTDVHEPAQAEAAGEVVDMLQIPAFLCRQTDLLVAAARTGRAVNIKKGQFVAPQDMRHAVAKVRESGNPNVTLTERGSSFGYHNLVVDMRSLAVMREFAPVVFDQPLFIPLLCRAAVAAGIDGLFLEVHDNPAAAKSDGSNALPLVELKATLQQLLEIRSALRQVRT
jgi:2-dehydro-3-deoxyphosphooctonate aldolase (KDO 8-P synthase)